jgi:hypothetical protein
MTRQPGPIFHSVPFRECVAMTRARMSVAAAEEMLRMLSGEPPRNFVNPQARRVNA